MEDFNKIGLNIWGIRGGYRCFCHTDNIDVETPEIANTWKDIREFLYVTDLTVRFYALEFTPNYKVFTIYRPENDTSRTGAYVATTIYVPHSLKILRILDLMRQISDAYHKDHYDAFGNPNSNPDYVQYYAEMIKNYASNIVRETDVRTWESSTQDNTPRIMPFTNVSVVGEFFDKPYRKEFLRHQEVMFWSKECLQNPQSHGLKFQKAESLSSTSMFDTDGKNIAPQFEGGSIRNVLQGASIERFVREGVDITQNWQSCFFYDQTQIVVNLKKPFHQPLSYTGPMIGTGSPFGKRGDDYEFSSARIDFRPRQYEIPVKVANIGNAPITLYFGNEPVPISGGQGTFRFDGSQANGTCKVTIRPNGSQDLKVTDFALSRFFVAGSDELDRLQPCIIESLKTFRFQFNQECSKGILNMRWHQILIGFTTISKSFETVLPAETKVSDFTINVDGYKAEVIENRENNAVFDVTLTKQNFKVDVVIPSSQKPHVIPDRVVLKVGGTSYKGLTTTIPTADSAGQMKMEIDVDGRGCMMECEFEKRPNNDDVVLLPKLNLLHNTTGDRVRLMAPRGAFDVDANATIAVPKKYAPSLKDTNKYNLEEQSDSEGNKTILITAKATQATASPVSGATTQQSYSGRYQGTGDYSGYQGGNTGGNMRYYGLYWFEEKECKLYENEAEILGDGAYAVTIEGRRCILCYDNGRHPIPEKQKKYAEQNKKNHFKVTVANGRCTVESTMPKPKGRDRGNESKKGGGNGGDGKKNLGLLIGIVGVVVIGALVGLGFALGWFGGNSKKNVNTIKIEMANGTKIKELSATKKGRPDPTVLVIDNSTIGLKKDWSDVQIVIRTVDEGDCPVITVDSTNNVTPNNTFFTFTPGKEEMKISEVKSPAWVEFEKIAAQTDTVSMISEYAKLANSSYKSAENVVQACIEKAKSLVNTTNTEHLGSFIENFEGIEKAKDFVERFGQQIASLEQSKKDEAEKQAKIKEFQTKMEAVYSMDCTSSTITKLESLYKELDEMIDDKTFIKTDVVLPVVRGKSQQGASATISKDWFKDTFIPNQKKFFEVFEANSTVSISVAKKLIQQTACFSKSQIDVIKKLTNTEDAFNDYKNFKSSCTDKKYYKYVNEKAF